MNFKILSISVFTVLISFSSCNFISEKLNKTTNSSATENNEILSYYNTLIENSNNSNSRMDRTIKSMEDYTKAIERKLANPNSILIRPIFSIGSITSSMNETSIPTKFKGDLQKKTDDLVKTMGTFQKLEVELKNYVEALDWEDDKGKKANEALETFIALRKHYNEVFNEVYNAIIDDVNKAELEILKDHPYKEQIIYAKEILGLTEKIVSDAYEFENVQSYIPLIEKQYNELENLQKKAETFKFSEENATAQTYFNSLNNNVVRFQGKMRILQRTLNGKKDKEIERAIDSLESEGSSVLSSYNAFMAN